MKESIKYLGDTIQSYLYY